MTLSIEEPGQYHTGKCTEYNKEEIKGVTIQTWINKNTQDSYKDIITVTVKTNSDNKESAAVVSATKI